MGEITQKRTYLLVCAALLLFTFVTYQAAFLNLGLLQTPVALAIAAAKAILIVLFFMNARYSAGITRVVMVAGLLWFGILMIGIMDDYITRGWLGVPGK